MSATVLATGGAGFVGSHVTAELLAAGRRVVVLDDFSNASHDVVARINALGFGEATWWKATCGTRRRSTRCFRGARHRAVVHLAGLKDIGESTAAPLRYVDVNVGGAVALLAAMRRHGVAAPGVLILRDRLRRRRSARRSARTRPWPR